MKFKTFECEQYSEHINYCKEQIERFTKEGILYSKILNDGVFNGKPINPQAIPLLKNDVKHAKTCIESFEKELDNMLWDINHAIFEENISCGRWNKTIKSCGHNKLVIIKCKEKSPHWGKEICPNCGKFQRWVSYEDGEKITQECEFK